MADANYLHALILGAVEGITEFLPISSTGHLIVAGHALGFSGEVQKTFMIVIQLGAILAVCWHYRARLAALARGLVAECGAGERVGAAAGVGLGLGTGLGLEDRPSLRFLLNLAVAMVPSVLIGLSIHGFMRESLFLPQVVAVALIVGGVLILLIERFAPTPRVAEVEAMSVRDAFLVGCAQAVALVPGVSRSGATIMGGLVFGLSRKAATEFSFFLAIPTMVAATSLDLYKNGHLLSWDDLGWFALGFIAAFVSALFAVRFLLHYVANHTFALFAWYRIAFGLLLLYLFWP